MPDERTAVLSADGRYRYTLARRWSAGPTMLWVLLNPSSADAWTDDPTLRRCTAFARVYGCGGLRVVNLWAWRAADPRALATAPDPVGPDNDAHIRRAARVTDGPLVVGWGVRARAGRVATVLGLLEGRPTSCLGSTRDGHPRHPLYVPSTARLQPWSPGRGFS